MLRLGILLLLVYEACQGQVSISGTFKYPDSSNVTGKVVVSLTRSTVVDTCAGNQVVTFTPVTVQITNGTLGPLILPATACLCLKLSATKCIMPLPSYLVKVYGKLNALLYMSNWVVPNTGSADVTELDKK